jgi:hypothetical protein
LTSALSQAIIPELWWLASEASRPRELISADI